MGAFDTGFGQGRQMYNDGVSQRRQKALDERATEEFGWRRAEQLRTQTDAANVDAAITSYSNGQAGISRDTQRQLTQTYGMTPQQVSSATQGGGVEGLRSRLASHDTPDSYDLQTAPAQPGFSAPQLRATAPTEVSRIRGLEGIAVARRDVASMERLGTARVGAEYNEEYLAGKTEWSSKTNEEKATIIKQVSYDQNIRGQGNWVNGVGKTAGYMNYLPDNGNPMQLSDKEVGDFFSLTRAMKIDPVRARKEMDGVSDKVKAMAKEVFDGQIKVATEVNNTAGDQGKLALMQKDLDDRSADRREGRAIQRAGLAARGEGNGKKADPVLVARVNELVTQHASEADPAKRKIIEQQVRLVNGQIAVGQGKTLQLPNIRDDRKEDPGKYFAALKSAQESGVYKTQGEARAAVDQVFGLQPASNIGANLQKLNQEAGQTKKPLIVKPGENGMRPADSNVMGDPSTFQRTSVRGTFGGLSYMYVDPVTGNKFTTEQYNQLQAQ